MLLNTLGFRVAPGAQVRHMVLPARSRAADRSLLLGSKFLRIAQNLAGLKNPVLGRSHFLHRFPLQNAHFVKKNDQNRKKDNKITKNVFWAKLEYHLIGTWEGWPKRFCLRRMPQTGHPEKKHLAVVDFGRRFGTPVRMASWSSRNRWPLFTCVPCRRNAYFF